MGIRKTLLLGALILMLVGCGSRLTKDASPVRCGGYTSQRELTDEEMEMFRAVTGTGNIVFTPISVSTQVVAGINYKFYCRFEETGDEVQRYCWVTIFKPLPGNGDPTLTSIDSK